MLITSPSEWLHGLRHQRSRTISTLLGVGWGTFTVVAMLAFGEGLEGLLRKRAEGFGRGVVITWINRTTRPYQGLPEGRQLLATDEDVVALLDQVPGMGAVSSEYVRAERVESRGSIIRTTVNGVFPAYGPMRSMGIAAGGRFLNDADQRHARRVAFLGNEIKRKLLGTGPAVGREIVLAGAPFTVIGVLEPKLQDSDYNGQDADRICIPSATYRRLFGDRWVDNFVYQAARVEDTALVIDGVYRVLGRRLNFDPEDRDALNTWDSTQGDKIRATMFGAMGLMAGLAGTLTLLVGGLSVGNLMFVLVKRRTREIGILMSLGAVPRWVLLDVLLQTLVLVAAGGLLGFLAAWGLVGLVALTPLTESLGFPRISIPVAISTAGLLMGVGLASGFFPARRAARLDPVKALVD